VGNDKPGSSDFPEKSNDHIEEISKELEKHGNEELDTVLAEFTDETRPKYYEAIRKCLETLQFAIANAPWSRDASEMLKTISPASM
jgi:hypothetical protein